MLVVKVELWPYGDEQNKIDIGRMDIANDASGTSETGNYKVNLWARNTEVKSVKDYPRKTNTVWKLVFEALKQFELDKVDQFFYLSQADSVKMKNKLIESIYGGVENGV